MPPRLTPKLAVLVAMSLPAATAFAQFAPVGLPDAALIAHADSYKPPLLTQYAKRLASQPDMSGAWMQMEPKGAGIGPSFDPEHTFYPKQPPPGEQVFGPVPGTYIRGIPYNAEYQKKYAALIAASTEGKSPDTFATCVPYGVPRMLGASPVPFDIVQAPDVMTWYDDYGRSERRIFLDGRPHPTAPTTFGAVGASYSGHSVGHWQGVTLVVDTVAMMAGYFDETPAPHSDKLHMVERIRLIDTNILQDQMTFTDPVTLAKPWVVTRYYRRAGPFGQPVAAGTIPRNYINLNDRPCVPNVTIGPDGFQVMMLPSEIDAAKAAAPRN